MYKQHVLLGVLLMGLVASILVLHPLSSFDTVSQVSSTQLPASATVLGATSATTIGERILFVGGGVVSQNIPFNDVFASGDMQQWTLASANGATPKWSKKFYPETFYFNNKYWVIGGLTSATNIQSMDNSVWSSPDGTVWTQVAQTTPFAGYSQFRVATLNGKMFVIGGKSQTSGIPSESKVWSSPDGINWTTITPNAPFHPRVGHSVVSFNGKLYVIGGIDLTMTSGTTYLSDVWSSSDGISWTLVTNTPSFGGISYAKGLVYQNKIFLLGGTLSGTSTPGSKVWSSPDGMSWTLVSSTMPYYDNIFSNATDAVVANGKIWLGNSTSAGQNKLWSTTNGSTWAQGLATLPWSPRYGYRLVSGPATTSTAQCTINSLTVPASTSMGTLNVPVSWNVSNCARVMLIASSGSYTTRYTSVSSTGSYTFTRPSNSSTSTKDSSIDIAIIASNDGNQIVSATTSVPIIPLERIIFPDQCDIANLNATSVPTTNGHQVTLHWSVPSGCSVNVDGWSPAPGTFQSTPVVPGIFADTSGSVTTNVTSPTTFYLTARSGGNTLGNTIIINSKTIDAPFQ